MSRTAAVLICDREELFRETLMNFLLTAGFTEIKAATNIHEALHLLHRQQFNHILIGMIRFNTLERRLKLVARHLQPQARIICMKSALPRIFDETHCHSTVLKEQIYEDLLDLLE